MKLLILSVEEQPEIERLKEEAKKSGHGVEVKSPEKSTERVLPSFTHVLVRAVKGAGEAAKEIAMKARSLGLRVVDERLATGKGFNKAAIYSILKKNGFSVPETIAFEEKNFPAIRKFQGKEVIIKDVKGKRGQDVFKVNKPELELFSQRLDKSKKYLAQEFLRIDKELRVLVVGTKVVGGFSKQSSNWKKNIAAGATPVKEQLSVEIKNASVKAASITKTEIAGIDLALVGGKIFVLEVNRAPGFIGFEKATGKNAAKEIIQYVASK